MSMRELINQALEALRTAGADRAQCWVTRSEKTELALEAGVVEGMFTTFNTGVTLTALVGNRKGTQTVNQIADIPKAAAEAVEQAKGAQEDDANDIAAVEDGTDTYNDGPEQCDRDAMYDRLDQFLRDVKNRLPLIRITDGGCEFQSVHSAVANTNGVYLSSRQGQYGCGFTFSAGNEDESGSMNYTFAEFRDLNRPFRECGGTGMTMEQSVRELGVSPLGEKFTGDVILAPLALSHMLEYFCDCYLAGGSLIAGTSLLKDKLGQRVAGENVTVVSNPSDPDLCGVRLTPDGFRAHDMTVIGNGILKSFLLSQYSANKTGHERSANYGDHLSLLPGDTPYEGLLAGVKRGLLVGRFSGGVPNDKGDFSGVAKNSFLIENGKIVRPVRETMIAGNLLEAFNNIASISAETISTGRRKNPWVRVSGIGISG